MDKLSVITRECMYGYGAYSKEELSSMSYGRKVLLESRFKVFQDHINRIKASRMNVFFRGLSEQCTRNTGTSEGPLYDFLNEPVDGLLENPEDGSINVIEMTLKELHIDGMMEVRRLIGMGLK